ncbi:MAG: site-specific DNA-methyltransferase [Thermoplasmatales archaeon B_DKE]|nr:MAG: site-specific DNA-methyltransferase [Thermoplasmatales archaeon B_DKE]
MKVQLFGSPNEKHGVENEKNFLILGDNLLVTKLLQRSLLGKVKCIYLDPPYNNQEDYRHFNDCLNHDEWLEFITERLKILKPLLSDDGSIWISIDDREAHYLKVAADSVFGRENFITTIIWQQRTTRENRRSFSVNHEYLLVYAKDPRIFKTRRNLLTPSPEYYSRYKNPDSDHRGPWQSVSATAQDGHATKSQYYALKAPNGKIHYPPKGRVWVYTQEKMNSEIEAGRIWFGKSGCGVPRIKKYLSQSSLGLTPDTLWLASEVGTSDKAKKQLLKLFPDTPLFDTPKPEDLISRIIQIATDVGELVLDPFLGSGTTAAVAHKMRRNYIGIELNPNLIKLTSDRLKLVINGDKSGCSRKVGWSDGGGFEVFGVVD